MNQSSIYACLAHFSSMIYLLEMVDFPIASPFDRRCRCWAQLLPAQLWQGWWWLARPAQKKAARWCVWLRSCSGWWMVGDGVEGMVYPIFFHAKWRLSKRTWSANHGCFISMWIYWRVSNENGHFTVKTPCPPGFFTAVTRCIFIPIWILFSFLILSNLYIYIYIYLFIIFNIFPSFHPVHIYTPHVFHLAP